MNKTTTLVNNIPAKWISVSNSTENIEGARARIHFKRNNTFIAISHTSSEIEKDIKFT